MRVLRLAWLRRACVCGIPFVIVACSDSTDDDATSSGGRAGEGGADATSGGNTATGGSLIDPNGGAGADAGSGSGANGGTSGSAGACRCPSGGDPYSVLVQGDDGDSILTSNVETEATASLACSNWLSGPLRGALVSTCSGNLNITFAACAGPEASPPCLLVDHNAVTYVDRDGQEWTGFVRELDPSTAPAIRDVDRQDGTFSVDVTRDDDTRTLSIVYILCGPGKPAALLPC